MAVSKVGERRTVGGQATGCVRKSTFPEPDSTVRNSSRGDVPYSKGTRRSPRSPPPLAPRRGQPGLHAPLPADAGGRCRRDRRDLHRGQRGAAAAAAVPGFRAARPAQARGPAVRTVQRPSDVGCVGLLPARHVSAVAASGHMTAGARGATSGPDRQPARRGLLVVQIGLALTLLVGSGLAVRSFKRLAAVDPDSTWWMCSRSRWRYSRATTTRQTRD